MHTVIQEAVLLTTVSLLGHVSSSRLSVACKIVRESYLNMFPDPLLLMCRNSVATQSSNISAYNLRTQRWEIVLSLPTRWIDWAVEVNNCLYMGLSKEDFRLVAKYDLTTKSWMHLPSIPISGNVRFHSALGSDDLLYLLQEEESQAVAKLDLNTLEWIREPDLRRYGYGAALVAGCVYILGGEELGGDVELPDRIEIRNAKAGSTRNLLVSKCSTEKVMMDRCTAATVVGHSIIAVCCESVTDIFTFMNIVQFDVISETLTRMPMYRGYAGPLVIAELVGTIYIFGKYENYTKRYDLRSHRDHDKRYDLRSHRDTWWSLSPHPYQLLKEEICYVFPIHSGSAVGALGKDLQVPAV